MSELSEEQRESEGFFEGEEFACEGYESYLFDEVGEDEEYPMYEEVAVSKESGESGSSHEKKSRDSEDSDTLIFSDSEEKSKFWWRTSGYNLDDLELPQDPGKANIKLQAMLVEELKKRERYAKVIEKHLAKQPLDSCNIQTPCEVSLTDIYQTEVKNLKQILDAFSDSYDDLNLRLTKTMKKCDKQDTIWNFLKDSSKKMLYDAQKRIDKKEIQKSGKKQGMEGILESISQWEESLLERVVEKAKVALEMEQVKQLVAEEMDTLQLADLQKQVSISAHQKLIQEQYIQKMQKIVGAAVDKLPSKFHEMRYNIKIIESTMSELSKQIYKNDQKRKEVLNLLNRHNVENKKYTVDQTARNLRQLKHYLSTKD